MWFCTRASNNASTANNNNLFTVSPLRTQYKWIQLLKNKKNLFFIRRLSFVEGYRSIIWRLYMYRYIFLYIPWLHFFVVAFISNKPLQLYFFFFFWLTPLICSSCVGGACCHWKRGISADTLFAARAIDWAVDELLSEEHIFWVIKIHLVSRNRLGQHQPGVRAIEAVTRTSDSSVYLSSNRPRLIW